MKNITPFYPALVAQFHNKFEVPLVEKPGDLFDEATFKFRQKFLQEELDELVVAYQNKDVPGVLDALVDLVYVAVGTADMLRLPFDAAFMEVHRANMEKERAPSAEASKRGSAIDVIKPPNWTAPDIAGVIQQFAEVFNGMREAEAQKQHIEYPAAGVMPGEQQ